MKTNAAAGLAILLLADPVRAETLLERYAAGVADAAVDLRRCYYFKSICSSSIPSLEGIFSQKFRICFFINFYFSKCMPRYV